ncbi:hypothetical protein BKA62DRAFT_831431 [Auriculariales sp. MPI-PUGE-AT-0066]|nr:hypothetical protein BKA62DRAFT_831431 [Auriculariales sp. MPI-PUGE-AT-0066]
MSNAPFSQSTPVGAAQTPPLPDTVVHLQWSMRELEAAAVTLSARKGVRSKTKEHVKLLVAAGNRIISAILVACRYRPGDLHVLAKSHVAVTRESIDEWTKVVRQRAKSSAPQIIKQCTDTASRVQAFALSMQALEDMLEIENGIAQLVVDPARRLGLSEARPSSDM